MNEPVSPAATSDASLADSSADSSSTAAATTPATKTGGKLPKFLTIALLLGLAGSLGWQWWHDPARHAELGMQALNEDDLSGIEQAAEVLANDPRYEFHAAFFQAVLDLKNKKPQDALEKLSLPMTHPDLEVESRVLAGQAAYEMNAIGNAKLLWEEALTRDPYCVPAHRWLGAMYFDLGAMDNAILHLQAVSRLDPGDPRPDRLMGLINYDYERPEIAIPHYQETLRRDPNQADVANIWLELADCHVKQREYAIAVEQLANCPPSARKSRMLAECKMNLGELEAAKTLAAEALAAQPDDVKTLQLNAQVQLVDGELAAAASLLRQAVEADPYSHSARTQLSQVLTRLGENDESKLHAQRADELQILWQQFSDLQIDAINQMTNADIRYQIGKLAAQLGKPELAVSWYRAALAINPALQPAAEALSEISSPQLN